MQRDRYRHQDKRVPEVKPLHRMPPAKYLSSIEIANVLRLLDELSDITQSASSHALAKQLIAELGGANWRNDTVR